MLIDIVLTTFLQSYTLEGLAVYTQYLVSLRVYNPEGSGPETIVVVMTDEGGKSLVRYKLANNKDVYRKIRGPTPIVYLSISLSANVAND
jgi:hypothetical protein